jgi:signal transduction histidine kinase
MFQDKHLAILFFVWAFMLLPTYAQTVSSEFIEIEIQKKRIENSKEVSFDRACHFFLQKNWDSTIVYSMVYLNSENRNKGLSDYCHYFRGSGFKNKKIFKEAEKEFDLISNTFPFYYKVVLSRGEIYLEKGDFKKACENFEQVEKLPEQKRRDSKTSSIYENLGLCYFHLEEFSKAESYFLKSAALNKINKDTLLLIGTYINIANLYYEQYQDTKAIPYFRKAYELSKTTKDFEIKKMTAENLAVIEENRNEFKTALAYRKEAEIWKDSLNDQNKVWALAQLEKKFALKEKEKEIYILETENKIKRIERNGLLYSTILLSALFGISIYFYRQKIKRNKIILAQKEELDILNSAKDNLFSIVSHDLRSSVNLMKVSNNRLLENLERKNFNELDSLLHKNRIIANETYNLLDNLLNWALVQTRQLYFQKDILHLESVIKQVEHNYKPLLQEKNISFENKISPELFILADLDSLKIVLRNLIDNAIKFSNEGGNIMIYSISRKDEFCQFVIKDNGKGMSQTVIQELLKNNLQLPKKANSAIIGNGLGISLCKAMIKKNDGEFSIESDGKTGTKIIITFPKAISNG